MYSGRAYLIEITIGDKWYMTHRVTEKAVENAQKRRRRPFVSALAQCMAPQFRQGIGKDENSPAYFRKIYDITTLRKCIEEGVAEFNGAKYTLKVTETAPMMARYAAREFIR